MATAIADHPEVAPSVTSTTHRPRMRISAVYSVAMTHLCVQFKDKQEPVRLKAAAVEEKNDANELLAKDDTGKVIGKFQLHLIAGWWTEDEFGR